MLKQWDSTLDGATRESHRRVDGEIRELKEKFSNGLMYPGDPSGIAAEVINCRCVALTRAKWALDEEELQILKDRAAYFGLDKTKNFDDFKEKYLEASKMAVESNSHNNWSKTIPKTITKQQRADLISYANSKGINIGTIKEFDGDVDLLKSQIDSLAKISSELPLGKKLTLNVCVLADDDFGDTKQQVITIYLKALRDRAITETNILNGNLFVSTKVEDIGVHEYGHVFAQVFGNKGLEIASNAYYNVFSKKASDEELVDFLYENISHYAVQVSGKQKFKEIIPEVLAKYNSNSDSFTDEFVMLLKEGYSNEKT